MFYVYAIKSIHRSYIYVGLTENLERRFHQHQSGQNKTTKPYAPFIILHFEELPTRPESRSREIYLKSGSGKEFLKSLLDK
ncbi:GIY-YIG nuclease family protein [Aridibaculum aurantiacum]|uniref:GIY-YIG nuclease family protein n=1 Tax=Aridibaculum aurantiacum TaxID=2810307 RepID=UPI003CC9214A